MKTIKLFVIAIITITVSSCSKSDANENNISILNKISGTTWLANIDKAWITNQGTYTINFESNSNVCTLRFIPVVKIYQGVKNEEITAIGTYVLDDGWGDRGYYILSDNDSSSLTNDMIFKRGQKTRIYVNNENFITNGVPNNHLEVSDGVLINNGSKFKTIFEPVK